ncbi:MAG: DUF3050 domain-containing protein [Planctomycetaceae bacterium]|nr:DUF3050 domain-containing protein [Planctomycetaceae bacterium]MBN8603761.1 DUF3050 domain-containing protein [Planctomycetota bacterium]
MTLKTIHQSIAPLRKALLEHPLYEVLENENALQIFMEFHVFAVWDFMSLLKKLQNELCCVQVPWLPPQDLRTARMINEIVLGEETDIGPNGEVVSHFELYRSAMQEFGASTATIDQLLQELQSGASVAAAIVHLEAGPRQFLQHTFAEIQRGDLCRIAAAFTFGREGLLPDVFTRIVQRMALANPNRLKIFQYYLQRHIELDGDNHGPLAEQLVERLCGTSLAHWAEAELAAVEALRARLALWDAIYAQCQAVVVVQ